MQQELTLFLAGIPLYIEEPELFRFLFEITTDLTGVKIVRSKHGKRQSRGFGFAKFRNLAAKEYVMQVDKANPLKIDNSQLSLRNAFFSSTKMRNKAEETEFFVDHELIEKENLEFSSESSFQDSSFKESSFEESLSHAHGARTDLASHVMAMLHLHHLQMERFWIQRYAFLQALAHATAKNKTMQN